MKRRKRGNGVLGVTFAVVNIQRCISNFYNVISVSENNRLQSFSSIMVEIHHTALRVCLPDEVTILLARGDDLIGL